MPAGTTGRVSRRKQKHGAGQLALSHLAFQDSEAYLGTADLDTTPRALVGISPQCNCAAARIGIPKVIRTMFILRVTVSIRSGSDGAARP